MGKPFLVLFILYCPGSVVPGTFNYLTHYRLKKSPKMHFVTDQKPRANSFQAISSQFPLLPELNILILFNLTQDFNVLHKPYKLTLQLCLYSFIISVLKHLVKNPNMLQMTASINHVLKFLLFDSYLTSNLHKTWLLGF